MVRWEQLVVLCALLATAGCAFGPGASGDAPTDVGGSPTPAAAPGVDELSVTVRATEDLAASIAAVDRRDAGNETLLNRTVALGAGEGSRSGSTEPGGATASNRASS